MARTTAKDVKLIYVTDMLTNEINAYIGDANVLVTQVLGTSGLGDSLLASIEKWLTAHMIATARERMATKEKAGEVEIQYGTVFGEGLKSTPYGQMVLALDTTGGFASLAGKSAKITAIKSFD